jgi:pimeloyl-ACP methyl ester carboxylesterase
MYNSVICHDEYIFGDYASAEARLVAEAPDELEAGLLQPVFDLFQMCGWWGAGRGTASENDPVFSDIPTLILAGQYDHATPVSWAYLTAQTLTDVYVYEFPGAGHSILSGQTCAIDITAAFLDDPGQEPDAGCVDQIEWPYFE